MTWTETDLKVLSALVAVPTEMFIKSLDQLGNCILYGSIIIAVTILFAAWRIAAVVEKSQADQAEKPGEAKP